MSNLVQDFLSKLDKVKKHGDYWKACCPAHDDKAASLSVRVGDDGESVLFKCHANCEKRAILDAVGLGWGDVLAGDGRSVSNKPAEVVARYEYTDAAGEVVFEVVRYRPKNFKQRSKDSSGNWIETNPHSLLFKLPAVLAAVKSGEEIWIAEGEKDVLALEQAGVVATCNPGGAGKWKAEYTAALNGAASIVIVRDRDSAGAADAEFKYRTLSKVAKRVTVVEAGAGKDAYDHLLAGLGLVDFLEVDPSEKVGFATDLPLIEGEGRQLRAVTDDAYRAILRANRAKPTIFSVGGNLLARVIGDSEGEYSVLPLPNGDIRGVLTRTANWVKTSKRPPEKGSERWRISRKEIPPPIDVCSDMKHLAPFPDMPKLEGIARCPVVDSWGQICDKPGYSLMARLFLDIPDGLKPSGHTAEESARWILEEVLCDFPFADDASRTHALALMLVPFLRPRIDGPVPMFVVDAPVPGSGKSLLGRVCLTPGVGEVSAVSAPKEEDEWRKLITSQLLAGVQVMFIDNVARRLDSESVCRGLTEPRWGDRMLGSSTSVNLPLRLIWVATSNNAKISTDISRRTVYIRLDPKMERPETRDGFKHENISRWMTENRIEVLSRLLDIVTAWSIDGCSLGTARMGSFESFAEVLSGVMDMLGLPGFLANADQLRESADDSSAQAKAFFEWWWLVDGIEPVTARQLRNMLDVQNQDLLVEMFGDGNESQQTRRLGNWLKNYLDRVMTIRTGVRVLDSMGVYSGSFSGSCDVRMTRATVRDGNRRFKLSLFSGPSDSSGSISYPYAHEEENSSYTLFAGDGSGETEPLGATKPDFQVQNGSGSGSGSEPLKDVWEDL